jgi:hypothetical protein
MVDPFDQGNVAAELADADKYKDMTLDEMIQTGLVDDPNYRDFPPPKDCFPEDGNDPEF